MVKILPEIAAAVYTIQPKNFNYKLKDKKNYSPAGNQKYRMKKNVPFSCQPGRMNVLVKQPTNHCNT